MASCKRGWSASNGSVPTAAGSESEGRGGDPTDAATRNAGAGAVADGPATKGEAVTMSTAGRLLRNGIRVFLPGTKHPASVSETMALAGDGRGDGDDDDITAVAAPPPTHPRDREISIHDFKDGWTVVEVTHTSKDPSRVWVSLESAGATLKMSIEEGVARTLRDRMELVLGSFSSIRNSLKAPER